MRTTTRLTNLSDRGVLFILIAIGILSAVPSALLNSDRANWLSGLLQDFATEMGGALVTFWLLQIIVASRQEKERLTRDLASSVNDVAKRAAEELSRRGWLYDGSLRNANLQHANLQSADLKNANLQCAILALANLQGARLLGADLQDACLTEAYLQGAVLERANLQCADMERDELQGAYLLGANLEGARLLVANLQGAVLEYAVLQGADLERAELQGAVLAYADLRSTRLDRANLQGAVLTYANLLGASLNGASFDESTTLPDGNQWSRDTDMRRFSDPAHPDFWQPMPGQGYPQPWRRRPEAA